LKKEEARNSPKRLAIQSKIFADRKRGYDLRLNERRTPIRDDCDGADVGYDTAFYVKDYDNFRVAEAPKATVDTLRDLLGGRSRNP
jgi:hypothetical protein